VVHHHWDFKVYHPALHPVFHAAQAFCSAALAGGPPRWLTLLGPSGVGKTHLLKQVLRFLRQHWRMQVKTVWPDGTRSGRTRQFAHLIPALHLDTYQAAREYAAFDLVYLEDLGSGAGLGEKGSGAVLRSRIAELLQLRSHKWTLACANLSRAEIAQHLDPRIASRLGRDASVFLEIPADVPDFEER
jgi:chromosomal replication initiation ATPase DnaA